MTSTTRSRIALACFAIVLLAAPVASAIGVSAGPADVTLTPLQSVGAPVHAGATLSDVPVTARVTVTAHASPSAGARPAWYPAPAPAPAADAPASPALAPPAPAGASPRVVEDAATAPLAPAADAVTGVTRFVDAPLPRVTFLERVLAALTEAADAVVAPLGPADEATAPAPASAPVVAATPGTAATPAAPAAVPPATAAAVLAATTAAALGWAFTPRGSVAALVKRVAGVIGLAGYARFAGADVLAHDERERLFAFVNAHPGASLADLVDACASGRSTVTHHLRVLEREGFVTSRREGRHRLYFPTGAAEGPRPRDAPVLAALEHETTRAVARAILAMPGLDQSTLCARLGLTPSLAHWHARRLEAADVLRRERDGRRVRYYPGPAAARVHA